MPSIKEQLLEAKELLDLGLLSQAEFDTMKAEILGSINTVKAPQAPSFGQKVAGYTVYERLDGNEVFGIYRGQFNSRSTERKLNPNNTRSTNVWGDVLMWFVLPTFPTTVDLTFAKAELERKRQIEHPHLAPVLDIIDTGDFKVLITEPILGSIYEIAREGELEAFLPALVDTVSTLHQHNTYHGGLSPFMIRRDGSSWKLMDLGLRHNDIQMDSAPTTVLKNSSFLNYFSPEQIGKQPVSSSTDQYSLALLMHWFEQGQLPWRSGSTFMSLLSTKMMSQYTLGSKESQYASNIEKGLTAIPTNRFDNVMSLLEAFSQTDKVYPYLYAQLSVKYRAKALSIVDFSEDTERISLMETETIPSLLKATEDYTFESGPVSKEDIVSFLSAQGQCILYLVRGKDKRQKHPLLDNLFPSKQQNCNFLYIPKVGTFKETAKRYWNGHLLYETPTFYFKPTTTLNNSLLNDGPNVDTEWEPKSVENLFWALSDDKAKSTISIQRKLVWAIHKITGLPLEKVLRLNTIHWKLWGETLQRYKKYHTPLGVFYTHRTQGAKFYASESFFKLYKHEQVLIQDATPEEQSEDMWEEEVTDEDLDVGSTTTQCINCNATLLVGVRYCTKCGTKQTAVNETSINEIPFRFEIDINSFKNLKTGCRGMGVVRFIASQRFSDCTIYGWCATDEERLQDKRFFTVRPNKMERWSMGMYPDVPGYYEMQYVLEFKLSNRKFVHFMNETPIHLMVPREGDTIQNVNISFGEKAVGKINDVNWQEIEFRRLTTEEFDRWLQEQIKPKKKKNNNKDKKKVEASTTSPTPKGNGNPAVEAMEQYNTLWIHDSFPFTNHRRGYHTLKKVHSLENHFIFLDELYDAKTIDDEAYETAWNDLMIMTTHECPVCSLLCSGEFCVHCGDGYRGLIPKQTATQVDNTQTAKDSLQTHLKSLVENKRLFSSIISSPTSNSIIPDKKFRNALKTYVPDDMKFTFTKNDVVLFYDDTMFGGAKDGFMITKTHIFGHCYSGDAFIYARLDNITAGQGGIIRQQIALKYKDDSRPDFSTTFESLPKGVVEFLHRLTNGTEL